MNLLRFLHKPHYYWHIHHGILVEHTNNIRERRRYVKEYKSRWEVSLRLQLMRPAKLPPELQNLVKSFSFSKLTVDEASTLTRLHKKQCHPRCPWIPQRSEVCYGSMLNYLNTDTGYYTLNPEDKNG